MIRKINKDELDIRYANWISMTIDLVKPKNLWVIGGRGTAKTQDILAKRIVDIVYDMPSSTMSFIGDTFVNVITNVIPELVIGLNRQKVYEGIHYVLGKEPPPFFKRSARKIINYKFTMCWNNGVVFLIKSLDRPSMNAGISVVHMVGDETKYDVLEKINKAFPTLRGDSIVYGDSVFFMGKTFLTDMPNPNNKEHDWILNMESQMDIKQIYYIFQTAMIVNTIQWDIYKAKHKSNNEDILKNLEAKLNRWQIRLHKIRKNSTMFVLVSSLVNVDILTFQYILDHYAGMDIEEFKIAILTLPPSLRLGERFYGALKESHFYSDGYNYDYYDNLGVISKGIDNCKGLKYLNTNKSIDAGADFGNMLSLVIGQEQGDTLRVLKDIHTLTPDWIQDLADKFVQYFEPHQKKHLYLYYDRAGNNLAKAKQDYASQLKKAIEVNLSGRRTGWIVTLMSIGQGNIAHGLEFDMMNVIMNETNPNLPKISIDKNECKVLKSSLELAPVIKKIGSNGQTRIVKDKSSEKKSIERLPLESTNMSDAFKYLVMRKKWIHIFKSKRNRAI